MAINTLSIILIMSSIIVSILVILFVKPKQNHYNNRYNNSDSLNFIGEKHNQIIDSYNDLNIKFVNKENSIRRLIILYQDEWSFQKLEYITNEFNKICETISDYLSRDYMCYEKKDKSGAIYCQSQLVTELNNIEDLIKKIDEIQPEQSVNNFQQNQSITETKQESLLYFDGCKTKEDAINRYRNLAKAFHPDNKGGNEVLFNQMKREYESLNFTE